MLCRRPSQEYPSDQQRLSSLTVARQHGICTRFPISLRAEGNARTKILKEREERVPGIYLREGRKSTRVGLAESHLFCQRPLSACPERSEGANNQRLPVNFSRNCQRDALRIFCSSLPRAHGESFRESPLHRSRRPHPSRQEHAGTNPRRSSECAARH